MEKISINVKQATEANGNSARQMPEKILHHCLFFAKTWECIVFVFMIQSYIVTITYITML